MNQNLPPSIIEMLKQRKLATSEAAYFVSQHLDTSPYDEAIDGVTVVMVAYRTGRILFDSIARVLDEPQVKQFIIIDNGSSEAAAQRLRQIEDDYDHVLLVQGHGNIGFGKGANLGAHLANQPWLVFLNPDAILRPGCVKKLVEAARGRPGPCLVGARLLNTDLTEQRGARRGEVTPVTTLLALTRLSKLVPDLHKYEIHYEDHDLPEGPEAVPTISGACFAVSKRDFARLKGFDSHFFLHVEDVDLCWRAREAGGTVLFHPHAEVIHEGQTSRAEPVVVEWNKGQGLVYFFNKRAQGFWRKFYVGLISPLILAVAVSRALLRKRLGDDEDELQGG